MSPQKVSVFKPPAGFEKPHPIRPEWIPAWTDF
jgi:hypothetical protein